ncbi:surface lipoprotein assembly modifier [Litoreibacter ponti]|uniref:surface lipoprotein assembly modifier n=1 Tax=Litoreibacter ponti TaxID=1510457 RepID=UPI0013050069|nr:surface lipoprotein assembly modifier [Litoreibacter ponti]
MSGTAAAQPVEVSLDQGFQIARRAFAQQNYALAHLIAQQILQAKPKDVPALLLSAASAPYVGRAKDGRLDARKAYLSAESPAQKRSAATFAAVASAQEKRPLLTQLWLRRAYQHSETEQQRSNISAQYRKYRQISPVRLFFSATVAPSSNLNGGADSQFLTIDGIYPVGVLSGSAQALSGTRATVRGQLTYTLSEATTRKTTLSVSGSISRVDLSGEAKALAPDISSRDLGDTQLGVSLRHQIAPGRKPIPDTYSLGVGQTWFGGESYYTYLTLGLGRQFRVGQDAIVRVGAENTRQFYEDGRSTRDISTLRAGMTRRVREGDLLSFNLSLSRSNSDTQNDRYEAVYASLGYELGEPIGPVSVAATIGYGETRYDNYTLGFFRVPGGRVDKTTRLSLDLTLSETGYLGFVPQINIAHNRTQSNVSRFERSTTGVGLSFVSAF